MQTEIINTYLALLYDHKLVFALAVTWAITHILKQFAFIKKMRRRDERILRTRLVAIPVGILAVMFFKRADADMDTVFNFAILIGFTSTFLYKATMVIVAKIFPGVDAYLSNDKHQADKKP
jgi:hypothetical protein